jgi:hypothetical protein
MSSNDIDDESRKLLPALSTVKKGRHGSKKRGRKAFQPTEKQRLFVRHCAGIGLPHDHIAALLEDDEGFSTPIETETLKKAFALELRVGRAQAVMKAGATLYNRGVNGGDNACLMFWLRSKGGYSERPALPGVGEDDGTGRIAGLPVVYIPDNGRGDNPGGKNGD